MFESKVVRSDYNVPIPMTIKYDYKEGLYVRYWTDVTVTVFSPTINLDPLIANISIPYEKWGDDVELALANAA
jgi:hypothetical protein